MKQHFKRQEISPGIILEKYQEKIGKNKNYVLKIETQIFNTVDFQADFTGSTNIVIEGQDSFIACKKVQPFTKETVAVLNLKKGWTLKTKFKFSLDLPDIELQQEKLTPIINKIKEEKDKSKLLLHLDVNHIVENELFSYLEKNNAIYVDHDFPPEYQSIDSDKEFTNKNYNSICHWRRAKFLLLDSEKCKQNEAMVDIFNKGANPESVVQGELANCWLLSAIAALAENPKLLKRVILTKKGNPYGLYRVKLCDMANWSIYSLDDYFPCYPLGQPFFAQNTSQELWPMLLEKAFAKKYGSYSRLVNGDCKEAFVDLTGCPTIQYNLNDPKLKEMVTNGELWMMIKEWRESKFYMTVGSKKMIDKAEVHKLPSEHAYTLKNIYLDEKIIELRDPLKILNFDGSLAKTSEKWTTQLRDKILPKFDTNHVYVTFSEFLKFFNILTVCQVASWNEIKIKGKYVKTKDSDYPEQDHVSSKWLYKITVTDTTEVIVGIHQKDERCIGVKETSPYTDLGFTVLTIKNDSYALVENYENRYERDVFHKLSLEAGTYFIVPRTSGMIFENELKTSEFDYGTDDYRINAITNDIFEKLDIDDNGILTLDELTDFFAYLGQEFTEADLDLLLSRFNVKEFPSLNDQNLNEKLFSLFFKDLLTKLDKEKRKELFDKLGYSNKLQSLRNKLFRMTFHSKVNVKVRTDDALKDALDQTCIRLLLKNKGIDLNTKEPVKLAKDEIIGVYYFNE